MDEYSSKRATDGVIVSRKGTNHVFRDTANNRDRNAQFCNRLGCGGRVNTPRGSQISCSEKGKSLRPPIRSSYSGKEVIGSSSRTLSGTSNPRKSFMESRKTLPSDSSETSSIQDEPEVSELIPPPEKIQRGAQAESKDAESGNVTLMDVGSSSIASNTRSRRSFHQRPGFRSQNNVVGCSVSLGSKNTAQVTPAGSSRYGLRNLKCNSVSDVIPSGCSSSDSSFNRRKDMVKKRNSEGESSSTSRGKKMSASSWEGRNSVSRNGISISDSRGSQNTPTQRDKIVASVRTRRSTSGPTRVQLSGQGNANPQSPNETPPMTPPMPHCHDLNGPSLSHNISEHSAQAPLSRSISYIQPGSSSERSHGDIPPGPVEVGITRSLMNWDGLRHYNMDGIAEVLLALERIEQDEELTQEQVLETSLFLNGLNFFDHHIDMRLDTDNMSYEELLALEERMGNVSTALTEEALSECIKRDIYQSAPSDDESNGYNGDKDDIKCSICQEEYLVGDEMGSLQCDHSYHHVCIRQWLQLKNWCPICKASAAPSLSSSSS
ncbi:E3 ubiquitin-protein ligase arkadia [Quillaja saponaria]|uniref:RING-type E3 ubiquitin transferase n=1 Tax=Quillaja saponaria TaxID=32244 RepID=A0AAD7LXA6_QUISA|nr:E3 ubiquitin-protein ligase arkadia [Quillaja saponaria]KAJ7966050.1 E3 ubiquitin-protein ligase arkadia [Quillaja saponaria]